MTFIEVSSNSPLPCCFSVITVEEGNGGRRWPGLLLDCLVDTAHLGHESRSKMLER